MTRVASYDEIKALATKRLAFEEDKKRRSDALEGELSRKFPHMYCVHMEGWIIHLYEPVTGTWCSCESVQNFANLVFNDTLPDGVPSEKLDQAALRWIWNEGFTALAALRLGAKPKETDDEKDN